MADAIRDGLRLEAIAADVAGDGDTALELLSVNARGDPSGGLPEEPTRSPHTWSDLGHIAGVSWAVLADPRTAAWKQAIGACKDLEPPGFMGHKRSAGEQEKALTLAQCMRDNGFQDFPDPTTDGPLIDTSKMPSARGREHDHGADDRCHDHGARCPALIARAPRRRRRRAPRTCRGASCRPRSPRTGP